MLIQLLSPSGFIKPKLNAKAKMFIHITLLYVPKYQTASIYSELKNITDLKVHEYLIF